MQTPSSTLSRLALAGCAAALLLTAACGGKDGAGNGGGVASTGRSGYEISKDRGDHAIVAGLFFNKINGGQVDKACDSHISKAGPSKDEVRKLLEQHPTLRSFDIITTDVGRELEPGTVKVNLTGRDGRKVAVILAFVMEDKQWKINRITVQ